MWIPNVAQLMQDSRKEGEQISIKIAESYSEGENKPPKEYFLIGMPASIDFINDVDYTALTESATDKVIVLTYASLMKAVYRTEETIEMLWLPRDSLLSSGVNIDINLSPDVKQGLALDAAPDVAPDAQVGSITAPLASGQSSLIQVGAYSDPVSDLAARPVEQGGETKDVGQGGAKPSEGRSLLDILDEFPFHSPVAVIGNQTERDTQRGIEEDTIGAEPQVVDVNLSESQPVSEPIKGSPVDALGEFYGDKNTLNNLEADIPAAIPAMDEDLSDIPAMDEDLSDIPAMSEDLSDIPAMDEDLSDIPAMDEDLSDIPAMGEDLSDIPAMGEDLSSSAHDTESAAHTSRYTGQDNALIAAQQDTLGQSGINPELLFSAKPSDHNDILMGNGLIRANLFSKTEYSVNQHDYESREILKPIDRVRANINAVNVLIEMDKAKKPLTQKQAQDIALFSGFGVDKSVFVDHFGEVAPEYAELSQWMRANVPKWHLNYFAENKESMIQAGVASEIITALRGVGAFEKGHVIMNPESDSGVFLSSLTKNEKENTSIIASSSDYIRARIAAQLNPDAYVFNEKFQNIALEESSVDVIFSDAPRLNGKLVDPNEAVEPISRRSDHFFLAKSIKSLKPGGVVVMTMSSSFMDSYQDFRNEILIRSEFMGAVRIPGEAIDNYEQAGLNGECLDVVFFKKRTEEDMAIVRSFVGRGNLAFANSHQDKGVNMPLSANERAFLRGGLVILKDADGAPVLPAPINDYYNLNKSKIIGEYILTGKDDTLSYAFAPPEGNWTATALPTALADIVGDEKISTKTIDNLKAPSIINTADMPPEFYNIRTAGSFFNHDGTIGLTTRTRNGIILFSPIDLSVRGFGGDAVDRIKLILAIGEKVTGLIAAQAYADDSICDGIRKDLNDLVDKFHEKYGFINDKKNYKLFNSNSKNSYRRDYSYAIASALEINYRSEITEQESTESGKEARKSSAEKASILLTRTLNKTKDQVDVRDVKTCIGYSLSVFGKIKPMAMVEIYGKSWNEIVKEASGLLVFDPVEMIWMTKDELLSDDVVAKIDQADYFIGLLEIGDTQHEDLTRVIAEAHGVDMIEALTAAKEELIKIKPERIEYKSLPINYGAFWMPRSVIEDFSAKVLDVAVDYLEVVYTEHNSAWNIKSKKQVSNSYATSRVAATRILEHLLNNTIPVVYNEVLSAQTKSGKKRVRDDGQTMLAQSTLERMKLTWDNWVGADERRKEEITDAFNDRFRRFVPRVFDGSLLISGISEHIKPRPSQMNVARRCLESTGRGASVLLDHEVGAGKTLAAIIAATIKQAAGVGNTAVINVPNHLIAQWRDAIYEAVPGKSVLICDEDSMTPANRQAFLSGVMVQKPDFFIIGHSAFGLIQLSKEVDTFYLNQEIAHLQSASKAIGGNNWRGRTSSPVENKIKLLKEAVQRVASGKKDRGISFDEIMTAIGPNPMLFTDESHVFKNMGHDSKMSGVMAMGNPKGSKAAVDFHMKTRFMRDTYGAGSVVELSGTPYSNSLTEIYGLIRRLDSYFVEDVIGIKSFDQFMSMLKVELNMVYTLTGSMKERLVITGASPLLSELYRRFADIVSLEDVSRMMEASGMGKLDLPRAEKITVSVDPTEDQKKHIGLEVGEDSSGMPIYEKGSLLHRADTVGKGGYINGKGQDNLLTVIGDFKKLGLHPNALTKKGVVTDSIEGTKMGACVKNIIDVYNDTQESKGTQLIFLDFSTSKKGKKPDHETSKIMESLELIDLVSTKNEADLPLSSDEVDAFIDAENFLEKFSSDDILDARAWMAKDGSIDESWNAYDSIRHHLIESNIPPEEIAFAQSPRNQAETADLHRKIREGDVRVVLGSVMKMGPGMNVQKRIAAVHWIVPPFRPSDKEQGDGRAVRVGNGNENVKIFHYVMTGGGDAGMYEILSIKDHSMREAKVARLTNTSQAFIKTGENIKTDFNAIKAAAAGSDVMLDSTNIKRANDQLKTIREGYLQNQIDVLNGIENRTSRAKSLRASLESSLVSSKKMSAIYQELTEKRALSEQAMSDTVASIRGNREALQNQRRALKESIFDNEKQLKKAVSAGDLINESSLSAHQGELDAELSSLNKQLVNLSEDRSKALDHGIGWIDFKDSNGSHEKLSNSEFTQVVISALNRELKLLRADEFKNGNNFSLNEVAGHEIPVGFLADQVEIGFSFSNIGDLNLYIKDTESQVIEFSWASYAHIVEPGVFGSNKLKSFGDKTLIPTTYSLSNSIMTILNRMSNQHVSDIQNLESLEANINSFNREEVEKPFHQEAVYNLLQFFEKSVVSVMRAGGRKWSHVFGNKDEFVDRAEKRFAGDKYAETLIDGLKSSLDACAQWVEVRQDFMDNGVKGVQNWLDNKEKTVMTSLSDELMGRADEAANIIRKRMASMDI